MTLDTTIFRERLLVLQQELAETADTARESAGTVTLDQQSVGRLSRMDALQSQQLALESGRRRQLQLTKITAALRRIEAGDFGVCFKCDENIDVRRLGADPTITRCIGCVDD